jgi:hypothetical protein
MVYPLSLLFFSRMLLDIFRVPKLTKELYQCMISIPEVGALSVYDE